VTHLCGLTVYCFGFVSCLFSSLFRLRKDKFSPDVVKVPDDKCGSLCLKSGLEFSLVGCSDDPLLGLVERIGVSVVENVGEALPGEHVRCSGWVASLLVGGLLAC